MVIEKNEEMEALEFKHSGSRYQIQTGVKCQKHTNTKCYSRRTEKKKRQTEVLTIYQWL